MASKLQLVAGITLARSPLLLLALARSQPNYGAKQSIQRCTYAVSPAPDRILVSQAVYDSLQEQYHFRRHDKVLRDVKSPTIWVVEGIKE